MDAHIQESSLESTVNHMCLPNPMSYPVQSHSPVMDAFQTVVKQKLREFTVVLSDADTYKRLTSDPTTKISEFLDLLLQEGIHLRIMKEKQRKYFLVSFPMCPALHAFSKTHKEVFSPSYASYNCWSRFIGRKSLYLAG